MAETDPLNTGIRDNSEDVSAVSESAPLATGRRKRLGPMTWLGCAAVGGIFGVGWEKFDNDRSLSRADHALTCRVSMSDRYVLQQQDRDCLALKIGSDKVTHIYNKDDLREYTEDQFDRGWSFDVNGLLIKASLVTASSVLFMAIGAKEEQQLDDAPEY